MNTGFSSLWFDLTVNQIRIYCFSSVRSQQPICYLGVDEHHVKTGSILDGSDLTQHDMMSHDLSSVDYFGDAEELKTNIGIEELRMLDQTNIITDPVMEDNLHLDNL